MAASRVALLAFTFTSIACAAGQLQLFVAPDKLPETLVNASVTLLDTYVSDEFRTRLRIRNTGDASVTLSSMRVAGLGFSFSGEPSLPHILAPGMNVDFLVCFRPLDEGRFSANLTINTSSYLLQASALPAITIFHNNRALVSCDTVDFGRAERGDTISVEFVYKNTLSRPGGVTRATVSGAPFSFAAGPPTPYLEPGQSSGFAVRFTPTAAGVHESTLTIDRRAFRLVGTATEAQIPRPVLKIDNGALRSGEQGRVLIVFAEKSRGRATGKLTMELLPAGAIQDNDAAVRFASGGRSVDIRVQEGQSMAGSEAGYWFQAGTTAGTIVFKVEVGGYTETLTVAVAPEPVRIDKASAVRTPTGIDVQFSGFDNTRSVSDVSLTFLSKSGQPLSGMPVKLPVTREFGNWWQASNLGGTFLFRASFPVSGDASQIAAVEVAIANASGKTDLQRMSF